MQEYTTTAVSDQSMLGFLNGAIPVLKDLRAIMGNWNGDEPGTEEDRAHLAEEAFNALMKTQKLITLLKEN